MSKGFAVSLLITLIEGIVAGMFVLLFIGTSWSLIYETCSFTGSNCWMDVLRLSIAAVLFVGLFFVNQRIIDNLLIAKSKKGNDKQRR